MLYLMHSIDQGELAGAIGSFRWLLVWTTPDKQGHTGTLIALVVSVGVCSIRENASLSHICRRLHYPVMHNSVGISHSTSLFHRFLRVSPRNQAAVNLRIPGDRQGLGRVGTIDRNSPL